MQRPDTSITPLRVTSFNPHNAKKNCPDRPVTHYLNLIDGNIGIQGKWEDVDAVSLQSTIYFLIARITPTPNVLHELY